MSPLRTPLNCIALAFVALTALGFGAGCAGRNAFEPPDGESPWRFARGDLAASAAIDARGYAGKLDVIWETKLSEKPQGPLTLAHNTLTYTGAKRRLFFVDPATGATLGKFKNRGCPQSGGLMIDSLLYNSVAPPFNYLDGYRLADGERIWRSLALDISAPLVSHQEKLFALSGDGFVYCLDRFSGDLIWERDLQTKSVAAPALDVNAGLVWVGGGDGVLYALTLGAGEVAHEISLSGPVVSSPAVGADGVVYCATKDGAAFVVTPPIDSAAPSVSEYRFPHAVWSAPAVSGERVVFSDNAGELYCFAGGDLSRPLWTVSLNSALRADPIIVGDFVIVGLLNRWVYCLSLATGEAVARRELDHEVRYGPISDGSRVFVASGTGRLFCLGDRTLAASSDSLADSDN